MKKHIYDENNGLHYTLAEDGMYYPDLALPEDANVWVGKYGLLCEAYLREHRNSLYTSLYLSGKLNKYLLEINERALQQIDEIVASMAKTDGIDEELKASDQMEWVGRMNNIIYCAEEIVLNEIVYV